MLHIRQSRVESHSQPGMYSRAARLGAGLTLARMRSLAAGGGCRSCAAAASEGQAFPCSRSSTGRWSSSSSAIRSLTRQQRTDVSKEVLRRSTRCMLVTEGRGD
ncbi:RHTO0S02e04214g1_1 [Rhodotorula toruloides]|uniref:RHTO0S02e04214g1_1 n=1 Tax=Rhodotorula toruloides TaxID=5286 RepID=A0A061AG96_RHOTO|nr:RHTO0S02e04214g1_1 [Rhodotorula toruloides]